MCYKPFFTIHEYSHKPTSETAHEKPLAAKVPVTQRGKEPKPQPSWITLCNSVNDGIFFSYQQVGKVILKDVTSTRNHRLIDKYKELVKSS